MDDAERLAVFVARLVRRMQTMQRLRDDGGREGDGHSLAGGLRELREMRDGVALDVLHDDEQLVFLGDDVERGHDVRMADRRSEPSLVEQHGDEIGIPCVVIVQSLDRNGAREAGSAEQPPDMHRRHAPRGDAVVHYVAADELASRG